MSKMKFQGSSRSLEVTALSHISPGRLQAKSNKHHQSIIPLAEAKTKNDIPPLPQYPPHTPLPLTNIRHVSTRPILRTIRNTFRALSGGITTPTPALQIRKSLVRTLRLDDHGAHPAHIHRPSLFGRKHEKRCARE